MKNLQLHCNEKLTTKNKNTDFQQFKLYNYTMSIDKFLTSSIPTIIKNKFPIHKILRNISKLLLLNLFESSLLNWVLQNLNFENAWKNEYCLNVIIQLKEFDEFIYQQQDYTNIFTFILFHGYYVKKYVNTNDKILEINKSIEKMSRSFFKCYQNWNKTTLLKTVNLQNINEIFIQHSKTNVNTIQQMNYNMIVDSILELSKQYNLNKEQLVKINQSEEDIQQKQEESEKIIKQMKKKIKKPKKEQPIKTMKDNLRSSKKEVKKNQEKKKQKKNIKNITEPKAEFKKNKEKPTNLIKSRSIKHSKADTFLKPNESLDLQQDMIPLPLDQPNNHMLNSISQYGYNQNLFKSVESIRGWNFDLIGSNLNNTQLNNSLFKINTQQKKKQSTSSNNAGKLRQLQKTTSYQEFQ